MPHIRTSALYPNDRIADPKLGVQMSGDGRVTFKATAAVRRSHMVKSASLIPYDGHQKLLIRGAARRQPAQIPVERICFKPHSDLLVFHLLVCLQQTQVTTLFLNGRPDEEVN